MKKLTIGLAIFAFAAISLFAQSQRWQIEHAAYGAGNHWVNVTDRVESLTGDGVLNFRVDNDVLGGDPFPGTPKTLRLRVRNGSGQERVLTYRENDFVHLAIRAFPRERGRLHVTRAQYGADGHYFDVTRLLNSQIQDHQLSLRVDNGTMGGDPAHGHPKALTVWYTYDGQESQLSVGEGQNLSLPGAASVAYAGYGRDHIRDEYDRGDGNHFPGDRDRGDRSGLRIFRADYGAQGRYFDVTSRLDSQIRGGQLSLRVTNGTMGGDPDENHPKRLTVWYSFDGRPAKAVVGEGESVNLPFAGGYLTGNLHILRAQYGADYRYRDVTDLLNSMIQGDQLDLRVTNEVMGGDPAPDLHKQLTVAYLYNGQQYRTIVNEKDVLRLPGAGTPAGREAQGSLEILRAMYGAGDRRANVTRQLRAMMDRGRLQIRVSNSTMGGDPAVGQRKELTVIYLWQGIRNRAIVGEGETLTLP